MLNGKLHFLCSVGSRWVLRRGLEARGKKLKLKKKKKQKKKKIIGTNDFVFTP